MNIMAPLSQKETQLLMAELEARAPETFGNLSMSVKVICINAENPTLAFVKNRRKEIAPGIIKEEGWGLPGGGVRFDEHETPKDAAIREFNQETGIPFSVFEILDPLGGFQKISVKNPSGYHYDIAFAARIKEMSPYARSGRSIPDPTEGTLEWMWVDPFRDIMKKGERYFINDDERVHGSSIAMINRFLFLNGD